MCACDTQVDGTRMTAKEVTFKIIGRQGFFVTRMVIYQILL